MAANRRFRPGWIPVIVTLVMLSLLISLGTWQLHRAGEKDVLLASYQSAPRQPVIEFSRLNEDWQQFQYRRLSLSGYYVKDRQLLMENQIRDGVMGYWVLTPFQLAGNDKVVLVNRGWIAGTGDRNQLPDIALPAGSMRIEGLVGTIPGVGLQMGSLDQTGPGWPRPVPYVDADWLQLQLAAPVMPWVLQLSADQPYGYTRNWEPALQMGPDKHRSYAATWFSLAAVLIILFVMASLKQDQDEEPPNELENREDERS